MVSAKRIYFSLEQPAEKYAKANRTAFIDCFNTKGIFCTKYVCTAGPLLSGTPISLSLTGSLQLMDICKHQKCFILTR